MGSADSTSRHDQLMARALEEARRGAGRTSPNPMVGCVVVEDGEILATGYHAGPGKAHAEADAFGGLDADLAAGTDVYVNLEPCCHHGRTPPCTDLLVDAGVERVFVGIEDPDPRVSGKGIAELRAAGIDVEVGVREVACEQLNRGYITYMTEGRPWVAAKWAMSADGKIATRTGHSAWITGERARRRVHELRDVYDAIMVGAGTLRADNPRLTCRIDGGRHPVRVVLDTHLEAPLESNVYQPADEAPETIVVAGADSDARSRERLEQRGLEIVELETDDRGWLPMEELMEKLADRGIARMFVEGGGDVLGSLFDARLVDYVHAFVGPSLLGGAAATVPVAGNGVERVDDAPQIRSPDVEILGDDVLISGAVDYSET